MQKKLALSANAMDMEEHDNPCAARLVELADASGLDLSDEVGWELLADQCEENGEPEDVVRLALSMAWRVALQRLHGMLEGDRGVMMSVGHLKRAVSSKSVLHQIEQVRTAVIAVSGERPGYSSLSRLLMRAALVTLDRIKNLHDRLKARGVLRER